LTTWGQVDVSPAVGLGLTLQLCVLCLQVAAQELVLDPEFLATALEQAPKKVCLVFVQVWVSSYQP
jgi:hypothetical protein